MIKVTEKAIKELQKIFEEQQLDTTKSAVRYGVRGGGCAGFEYRFEIDQITNKTEGDETIVIEGINFLVDKKSLLYLDEVTVDFKEELHQRGFDFINPSAKRTCGCNRSFST
jgi:iron-sulfur cluster assembly protein